MFKRSSSFSRKISKAQANFALLWIAVFWGSTFTMVKGALDSMGPSSFIAIRFTIAAVLLGLLFPHKLHRPSRREWWGGGLTGVTLGLGYIFQTVGLQYTTSAKAGFITGLYIVIVPLLTLVVLKEQIKKIQWMGIGIATVGLACLSLNAELKIGVGDGWILLCALMFAFQCIFVSYFAKDADAIFLTFIQLAVVAIVAWAPALVFETPFQPLPWSTWAVLLFTAIFATLMAFLIQMWAQPQTSATAAALIMSLEAVFAALVGWWWAGEMLSLQELLGCLLMLFGMGLVECKSIDWGGSKPFLPLKDS